MATNNNTTTEKVRKFVFLLVSQNYKSNYAHSSMADEREKYGGFHVYGIYDTNAKAIKELAEIYVQEILGVQFGLEYFIIKKTVN